MILLIFLLSAALTHAYFPSPLYEQTVYVNQSYSGFPQDGNPLTPYISITQALESIVDASPFNRYRILIEPGIYSESPLHIIANVFLTGSSSNYADLTLDSDFDLNHESWTIPPANTSEAHISGLYGMYISPNLTVNLSFVGNSSDFFIYDISSDSDFLVQSDYEYTRLFIANSAFTTNFTIKGTTSTISNGYFYGNGITVYSSNYFTQLIVTGGTITQGTLAATWTSPDAPLQLLIPRFLISGSVLLSGTGCNATLNRYYLIETPVILEDGADVYYYE